jgi:hypothetical protein
MKLTVWFAVCVYLVGATAAAACSGRMPLALPNTIVSMHMTVKRGHPCGPMADFGSSTLTIEGLAVTQLPKLGTVEPMRPAGFRYVAHSVGRDRFQVAYTGRTSLGVAYAIRYNVNVNVTP